MTRHSFETDSADDCAMRENAASYVCGEMEQAEGQAFETHMKACASCRELARQFQSALSALRSAPEYEPRRDLLPGIIGRIGHARTGLCRQARFPVPVFSRPLALAAGLVAALAGGIILFTVSPSDTDTAETDQAVDESLAWLASAQKPSGEWDPKEWGGDEKYRVALTGMALLSFVKHSANHADERTGRGEVIDRAVDFLLGAQEPSGRFGPEFDGAMYNHGIATLALAERQLLAHEQELEQPIARAAGFIRDRQLQCGGWGYAKNENEPANTSITVWQITALAAAAGAGWEDPANHVSRGLFWLSGTMDEQGRFGYQKPRDFPKGSDTLTAMGVFCMLNSGKDAGSPANPMLRQNDALARVLTKQYEDVDYYRHYFIASAATATGKSLSHEILSTILNPLLANRVRTGENSGSWNPSDQWGPVGGRIYSTSLATLSLEALSRSGD